MKPITSLRKKCPKCGRRRTASKHFYIDDRKLGGFYPVCKDCHKATVKRWRKNNPDKVGDYHRVTNKKKRELLRKIVDEAKDVPCMDCGVKYPPYVMDFNHLKNKKWNVSKLAFKGSVNLLLSEIAKCEVVCSNCHRERTFGVEPDKCDSCRRSSSGRCRRHQDDVRTG